MKIEEASEKKPYLKIDFYRFLGLLILSSSNQHKLTSRLVFADNVRNVTKNLKTKETLWSINDVTMAENGFCSSKLFIWNYHDVWYYHQDITWKENMYKKASFRMWTMWKYYEFYNKLEGPSDKEALKILISIVQGWSQGIDNTTCKSTKAS